ncbi:MAG: hypothetical protein LBP96_01880, partial [Bacteroidales bacterium]|nr:hypothetical protein [Bacteroidales bacterium]
MERERYLLDTQTVWWWFSRNKRLPKDLREDIDYCYSQYAVSFDSIRELVTLNQLGKIDLTFNIDDFFRDIEKTYIDL